jgi:NAD(P)H-dependent FMN reductase
MKFLFLNGSLTPSKDSNTQKVIDRVRAEFARYEVETDEIVLRDLTFEPGVDYVTYKGEHDDMTDVLRQILEYDGIVFCTPIWWGTYSSYIQALMERMGYIDDWAIKHNFHPYYGKTFGILISGSDDGWQQTAAKAFGFASYLGFTVPPDAFVSAVRDGQSDAKSKKDFEELVAIFTRNQVFWAKAMESSKVGRLAQVAGGMRTGYTSAKSIGMNEK